MLSPVSALRNSKRAVLFHSDDLVHSTPPMTASASAFRSGLLAIGDTERAFEHGLIVWPNVGHVDGERGDIVMLGPPLTVGTVELEEIGSRLARALAEV